MTDKTGYKATHLTVEEWKKLQKPVKDHKFNAKRTVVDGESFPSKLEAAVYAQLKMLERAGQIKDIKRYPTVHLSDAKISWQVDAMCFNSNLNGPEWHEAKGVEQSDYRIKLKLWRVYGPGPLHVWKGSAASPKIYETIIPKGAK